MNNQLSNLVNPDYLQVQNAPPQTPRAAVKTKNDLIDARLPENVSKSNSEHKKDQEVKEVSLLTPILS